MFTINTYIRDIDTNEALSFASVGLTDSNGKLLSINGNYVTRKADIDGKLIIPVSDESAYITVSYVGYQTISHPADDYRNDTIYLKKKAAQYGGKEIVIKAKRPKPKPELEKIQIKTKPQPKKEKIPWLLIAGIAAGVIVLGTALYFIITKTKK